MGGNDGGSVGFMVEKAIWWYGTACWNVGNGIDAEPQRGCIYHGTNTTLSIHTYVHILCRYIIEYNIVFKCVAKVRLGHANRVDRLHTINMNIKTRQMMSTEPEDRHNTRRLKGLLYR